MTISFASASLPLNQKATAAVSSTGISVKLNKDETFANLGELQSAVNAAIKEANGGVAHPAGDFIFQMDPSDSFVNLTGHRSPVPILPIRRVKVPFRRSLQTSLKLQVQEIPSPAPALPHGQLKTPRPRPPLTPIRFTLII